ncbi:hypothetical protein G7009_25865 [Pseudomonas capeferrum]|uniref:hypothetical protein n=1 Tax=Pseudomonas capeferrum TaxID=1495066 RepID=UPI0015E38C72|nr:hypothetical protein [Pseudomonas capeferrum]MBA1205144.1 hypothetical protein [Pseudomonas capeferrum]
MSLLATGPVQAMSLLATDILACAGSSGEQACPAIEAAGLAWQYKGIKPSQ